MEGCRIWQRGLRSLRAEMRGVPDGQNFQNSFRTRAESKQNCEWHAIVQMIKSY